MCPIAFDRARRQARPTIGSRRSVPCLRRRHRRPWQSISNFEDRIRCDRTTRPGRRIAPRGNCSATKSQREIDQWQASVRLLVRLDLALDPMLSSCSSPASRTTCRSPSPSPSPSGSEAQWTHAGYAGTSHHEATAAGFAVLPAPAIAVRIESQRSQTGYPVAGSASNASASVRSSDRSLAANATKSATPGWLPCGAELLRPARAVLPRQRAADRDGRGSSRSGSNVREPPALRRGGCRSRSCDCRPR